MYPAFSHHSRIFFNQVTIMSEVFVQFQSLNQIKCDYTVMPIRRLIYRIMVYKMNKGNRQKENENRQNNKEEKRPKK